MDKKASKHPLICHRKPVAMEQLEIEIKFYLADVKAIRRRILDLGAKSNGRLFEINMRFDDHDGSLFQNRSLLRLRRDARTRLTYKSKPGFNDPDFKVLKELEVDVGDFATMKAILEALGFHNKQIYEKWRETFILDELQVLIDEMPYGNFLEIEGDKELIRQTAGRLGLKWETRILYNYLELFDMIKQKINLPFSDLTFHNFKNLDVDLPSYLHLIQPGDA